MLRIGPSGNSKSFYESGHKHTVEAPAWLASLGLTAYEYSFGRGITLGEKTAIEIGNEAKKYDIAMSVHAPYYINFANPSKDMIEKSIGYLLNSARYVKLLNGNRIIFHTATCGKMERSEALNTSERNLEKFLMRIENNSDFNDCIFCPETMGKMQQIGTVEEIVGFCKLSNKLIPCFDFGHINSYSQGGIKCKDDYKRIIDYAIDALGEKARKLHIHFSKIMYGASGEIKHLTLEDNIYGPEYEYLAEIIDEYGLQPTIICESKEIMADDALKMKKCHKIT